MSTVQEIETAIEKLSDEQVEELRAWLFDRELARDATSGLLDPLARRAIAEIPASTASPARRRSRIFWKRWGSALRPASPGSMTITTAGRQLF